ncbi:MAG: hypothetical protein ABJA10_03290 [Aestuariivirga sp.]
MTGRLFWLFTAAFLGLAVHLATILYLPGLSFGRNLGQVTGHQASNSFFVMKPEAQVNLLPMATTQDIVGLCLVDISKGNVIISAHGLNQLWSLVIYQTSGQQVYGINDVEAGTGDFSVELSKSKSLLQQLSGKPEAEDAKVIENIGWHAELSEDTAIAVLWMPVPDALQRPALENIAKATICKAK